MIGEIIKHRRIYLGYTTRELAQQAGITQRMLTRYERQGVMPTKKVMEKLAVALEISLEELQGLRREWQQEGFNQKEFDNKLNKARTFNLENKITLNKVLDTMMELEDLKTALNKINEKANRNLKLHG
jgi:transcriptional regulator with XRE-family HTH domain